MRCVVYASCLSDFFICLAEGPSIKYVTLFRTNFDSPFPLSHIVTHLGTPLKYVTHLGNHPRMFSSTCIHTYVFTGRFVLVLGGSCPGCFVRVLFVWKLLFGVAFVRPPICQNTSVTTDS